jgi:hypothetical protein
VPAVLAGAAICAAGCGGSGGSSNSSAEGRTTAFPAARGLSLAQLRQRAPAGPVLSPTVSLLRVGANRVGFGLFDVAHKQLTPSAVAVYLARSDGIRLRGPYRARAESLTVKAPFRSRTTALDPDAAKQVYVADVPIPRAGRWAIVALASLGGRLASTNAFGTAVTERGSGPARPPGVGEAAVRVHTPTVASAGGDLSSIDTRQPPAPQLHRVDFAAVLGRRPVVLVFATPLLCRSRVCGPVVDVAAEVQQELGDRVAFIHQEIYRDNEVARGFRPQVGAWRLPTEPWTFVIDRRGIVRDRFEGAVSVAELRRAAARVAR